MCSSAQARKSGNETRVEVSSSLQARMSRDGPLIGAIDQGTTSSRFFLFNERCQPVGNHYEKVQKKETNKDWFEQDPNELIGSVRKCLDEVGRGLKEDEIKRIRGIGITNQRETTILWDKTTGEFLHKAIVWCDARTAAIAEQLIAQTPSKNKDDLRPRCGLPIHTYFSALKVKWMMENSERVLTAIQEGRCLFGTVDTWIIWNLTGGVNGGVHVTDVTNASRTMLMNIHTLQWDPVLCRFFGIPEDILPEIRSSAETYGHIAEGPFKGVPLCGCLGDQQAALVGQQCFSPGDAKNTYGTGCFLLYNTGQQPVMSHHGLLTTVAYQLGPNKQPTYALEGAVSIAGEGVQWLKEKLKFFDDENKIEEYAREVTDTADVYFVPAFSGLYAPYWQPDARGLIIGLTNFSRKAHLCRATLEAVCFQSREILDAMNQDSELPLTQLKVDGGMTVNELLLELQADILGMPVVRPEFREMTVLGAAFAAGTAAKVWRDVSQLPDQEMKPFNPKVGPDERDERYARWKEAVRRSMNWQKSEHQRKKANQECKTTLMFTLGCLTGAALGAALMLALKRR